MIYLQVKNHILLLDKTRSVGQSQDCSYRAHGNKKTT